MQSKKLKEEIQTVTMSLRNVERLLTAFQAKLPEGGIDYLRQDQQLLRQRLVILQEMAGQANSPQI